MPNYTTTGHQRIFTWVKYHSYIIFTQRIVNTACCSVSNILLSILHLCPFTLRHSWNPNSTVSLGPIDVIRVGEVLCPIIMHLLVMRTILLKPKGETVGEGGWGLYREF